MATLNDLVWRVLGNLNQFAVNRQMSCTFVDWVLDGADIVGVELADVVVGNKLNNVLVELATGEVIHLTSYDPDTGTASCPPWFRGQLGSPQDDDVPTNSRAIIEPLWPLYSVAQAVVDGINQIYPDVFVVREADALTSNIINGNYQLPDDVETILSLSIEADGPAARHFQIYEWTMDISNPDGNRYLRTHPSPVAGRPIHVTYRAKPVVPLPTALDATWTSTGLPDSAQDLPVLYATYTLLPSVEAAKTQVHSSEQSDRNRLVQVGSASAASRRFQEMFETRRHEERRKLLDRFPPKLHKDLNG